MATRTKEKAAARKANADKRPQAHAKYVRISPRKVKIVIDLIRGKNVDEALAIPAGRRDCRVCFLPGFLRNGETIPGGGAFPVLPDRMDAE